MIIREIVLTCSNPHVARAAVASIGRDFARRFSRDAAKRNLTSGVFAAGLVRRFSRHAGDGDWVGVGEATRGADSRPLGPEVHSGAWARTGRGRLRRGRLLARACAFILPLRSLAALKRASP